MPVAKQKRPSRSNSRRHVSLLSCLLSFVAIAGVTLSAVYQKGMVGYSIVPMENRVSPTSAKSDAPVMLGPPEQIIEIMTGRYKMLNGLVKSSAAVVPEDAARMAYLELLKSVVSATAFGDSERSIRPSVKVELPSVHQLDADKRWQGRDWTYLGVTMTGTLRLNNVRDLLVDCFRNNIPGDYIETGVWRGGSSIYARGVIEAFGESKRHSYVCDSFQGLPPGDKSLHKDDIGWDNTPYLEVSQELVTQHFDQLSLLDRERVHFVKGFFNNTMPVLRPKIGKLAVMRLDGDMYRSTVDVLYHLYDKLSIGGYVIMDDWFGFPSKDACEDFFEVHGISPTINRIDQMSAYWKKETEVDIQYWRYETKRFRKQETQP